MVDPTIQIGGSENYFKWQNLENCSTNTNSCETIIPEPSYVQFKTQPFCWGSEYEGVSKPLFRFNISELNYGDVINTAKLYYRGTCVGEEYMPSGKNIQLFRIDEFSGEPDCNDNPDTNISSSLETLMYEDTCDKDGSQTLDITDILQNAVNNVDEYLAFKTDIYPELSHNEQPGQNDYDYYYDINKGGSQLYIKYLINCTNSYDCLNEEFCNQSNICEPDVDYGDDCDGLEVTSDDDEACPHDWEECNLDEYDGTGYFCDQENKCTHDGSIYNEGDKHCYNSTAYRQCTSGSWATITECTTGWECNDPSGCQQGNPDLVAKNSNIIFFRIR